MNFLGHYYFDHKEGQPYFNLGLVMPDLLKISGYRVPPALKESNLQKAEYLKLNSGIRQHIFLDGFFHNSEFFKENQEIIKVIFKRNKIQNPPFRIFFISHIFLELMIDRVIIKTFPPIIHDFYRDMELIDTNILSNYLSEVFEIDPEKFIAYFERFLTAQYLYSYPNNEKLIFSLNRIFQRVKQPTFEREFAKYMDTSIEEYENYLTTHLQDLEMELKTYVTK